MIQVINEKNKLKKYEKIYTLLYKIISCNIIELLSNVK